MLLIRDVFRCKPGKARQVAELFKRIQPSVEQHDGYRNVRIMVDLVTNYWTVVLEAEVEELTQFEHHMRSFGTRPEDQEVIRGYLDLVEGGHREIYRIL